MLDLSTHVATITDGHSDKVYQVPFSKLDAVLYQYRRGYYDKHPEGPIKAVEQELNVPMNATAIMALCHGVDRMKEENRKEIEQELKKVGLQKLNATIVSQGGKPFDTFEEAEEYLVRRNQVPPAQAPAPVAQSSSILSVTPEEARLLMHIGMICAFAFRHLNVDPEWIQYVRSQAERV